MENNTNINDPTLDAAGMLEEGQPGEGMRQRPVNPAALTPNGRAKSTMSLTSKMYDVDGDGKLDETERAMREMDTDNRGYLTNEKVYKIMLEQMKLQQEVFGLKRMSLVFLAIVFFLSIATLGTSFAAAILAKDTKLENGNLVSKDGGGVVGTSNVATTFAVTQGAAPGSEGGSGRRTQGTEHDTDSDGTSDHTDYDHTESNGFFDITITKADAIAVYTQCDTGVTVFLERKCQSGLYHFQICPDGAGLVRKTLEDVYNYPTLPSSDNKATTIKCPKDASIPNCKVTFPIGTAECRQLIPEVILGGAGAYAILAKTGITTVPFSAITGDIAVSPIAASAMTGFGTLPKDATGTFSTDTTGQVSGQVFAADYVGSGGVTPAALTVAVLNMQAAYTDAAGRPAGVGPKLNHGAGILGGAFGGPTTPLTSGVYTFGSSVLIAGELHFVGSPEDIFIIQISGDLTMAANYKVILDSTWLGTPLPENIFWQIAGKVEIGAGSEMVGIMLIKTDITFITGSKLSGRVLTQTMCALQSATITQPV
jgi:hypothetical protein